MHRAVENFVDGAEVLADLVRLADHVVEKAQIGIGIADEVVHRHVAGLAVAVEPAVALLQSRRIPGAVVVQQVTGGAVQVEALGRGVGGDENAHRRGRIVERRLDVLAARLVHALRAAGPEERQHPIGGVALPQAPGQTVEGGLVLREDDQALIVAEGAARAEQTLDQRDEGIEARIGNRRLFRDRGAVEREAESIERAFDAPDLFTHIVDEVPEPRAHDGRGGGFALLGFPVVAGLLAQRALGRGQLRFGRGLLLGEPLSRAAPGFGERAGAGEEALAEDLHREGSGAATRPGSRRHEPTHGGAEGVERGGEPGFARIGIEGQGLRRMAGAEARGEASLPQGVSPRAPRRKAPRVDVAFQPANDHIIDAPAHGGVHLARAGEAHRIEHLQQARERARVAVVRGGGEKEPVLELRRHKTQHPAKLAVLTERRRHQVVALVDDQQIPGQMRPPGCGRQRGTAPAHRAGAGSDRRRRSD